jgi:3D (Asp-Asp-Asp) domain-containing protein
MKTTIRLIIVLIAAIFACDNAVAAPKKGAPKPKMQSSQSKTAGLVPYLESRGMDSSKAARLQLAKVHHINNYDFSSEKNNALLAALKAPVSAQPTTAVAAVAVAKKPVENLQPAPKAQAATGSVATVQLQHNLQTLGYKVDATGSLDKATIVAYIAWQHSGFFRGAKGVITPANVQKIQKLTDEKTPAQKDHKLQRIFGSVRTYFARPTCYTSEENTIVIKKVTKIVHGKKKKVLIACETDPWTKKGLTFTGAPQFHASPVSVGTIAVDPDIIPYGSPVMVPAPKGPEFYIAADTGSAVVKRTAAIKTAEHARKHDKISDAEYLRQRNAIVVDCVRYGEPACYANIMVLPYQGTTPFKKLSRREQLAFFDMKTIRSAFAPYLKGQEPRMKNGLLVAKN